MMNLIWYLIGFGAGYLIGVVSAFVLIAASNKVIVKRTKKTP